ncbi:MAG TPA: hypothetical protein VG649_05110 [Candidatus Angelobacter sp.]|jgi:hypothetical protein|nr:hypothetical protein [Candidatus Angelobacter sp.]
MIHRSALLILFTTIFLWIPLGSAQDSTDWRKHYGSPVSERYVIRDGITMTVFYSEEGRTCKTLVEPLKPEPTVSFEEILNEIIPLAERGKQIHSLGLTSGPVVGIAYRDYERVRIALVILEASVANGSVTDKVVSATIDWKGIQCRLQDPPK